MVKDSHTHHKVKKEYKTEDHIFCCRWCWAPPPSHSASPSIDAASHRAAGRDFGYIGQPEGLLILVPSSTYMRIDYCGHRVTFRVLLLLQKSKFLFRETKHLGIPSVLVPLNRRNSDETAVWFILFHIQRNIFIRKLETLPMHLLDNAGLYRS